MAEYFNLNYTGQQVKNALDKTQQIDGLKTDVDNLKAQAELTEKQVAELFSEVDNIKPYVEQRLSDSLIKLSYNFLDYEFAKTYFESDATPFPYGACSTVRSGNLIGRNLDWKQTNSIEYLVEIPRLNGRYASINMVSNIEELAHGLSAEDFYKVIPFYAVDGINEHGLFVSNHVVKRDANDFEVGYGSERINQLMLVRYILDTCKTVDEAVETIKEKLTIYQSQAMLSSDYECQYFIADKTRGYTVAFANGEIRTDTTNILTNFRIPNTQNLDNLLTPATITDQGPSVYNNVELYGAGLERYNIAFKALYLHSGILNKELLKELMTSLFYSNTYKLDKYTTWYTEFTGMPLAEGSSNLATVDTLAADYNDYLVPAIKEAYAEHPTAEQFWYTKHSSIYDLETKKLYLTLHEDTTKEYEISFDLLYKFASAAEVTSNLKDGIGNNSIQLTNSSCIAKGDSSVALGVATQANGNVSVVEGVRSVADGEGSHAEGLGTTAMGEYSHAEGVGTVTNNRGEHAEGIGNKSNADSEMNGNGTISSIGIGNPDDPRNHKNAFEVLKDGSTYIFGVGSYNGTNPKEASTIQSIINSKETAANKVTLGATNTTDQYPNAKSVWDNLQNVREVAEGKSSTYVVSYKFNLTYLKDYISMGAKVYNTTGEDITQEVSDGDYDDIDLQVSIFDSDADTVSLDREKYLIVNYHVNYPPSSNFILGKCWEFAGKLKLGDIILVAETTLTSGGTCPDRWFGGYGPTVEFYKLETSKIDISGLSTATNLENGAGENSLQQKQSSKEFEFDNPSYDPSEKLPDVEVKFGAFGKDSAVLNGNSMAYGSLSTAEGRSTLAIGDRSHSEGTKTVAANNNAHAEGLQTAAVGDHSHAEGEYTIASGMASHAENNSTQAIGNFSHAEGEKSVAKGSTSHAEGTNNTAAGDLSHAGGFNNYIGIKPVVNSESGSADGSTSADPNPDIRPAGYTLVEKSGFASFVGGLNNKVYGNASFVFGNGNVTENDSTYLIGTSLKTSAKDQIVLGKYNIADENNIFEIGNGTSADRSNAFSINTNGVVYVGKAILSETDLRVSTVGYVNNKIDNIYTKSEINTLLNAKADANKINDNIDLGAGNIWAATRGGQNMLAGYHNIQTQATYYSSAIGRDNTVSHSAAHLLGSGLKSNNASSVTVGNYNDNTKDYIFAVGCGKADDNRHNAFEVYADGHAEIQTVGSTNNSVATKQYVDSAIVTALNSTQNSTTQTIKVGNTTLTEEQLKKLIELLDTMEVE